LLFNRLLVGPEGVRLVTPQTLNNITRKDLIECYKKYFVPNNMYITIGGDISLQEVKESLNNAFKNWQPKEIDFPELPKIEDKSTNKIYYVYKDIPQANILIGHYIDMNWDHPDIQKMQIMNAIFGDGFTSRLSKEIRVKRGWTYGISGGIRWGRANGSFRISSSLKAESLGEALSIVKEIVKGMQTELVTDKELEKTKRSRIYASVFRNRNPLRVVSNKMYRKHIQGRPEVEKPLEKIRKVTKENVLEVAKKYININNLMMVIVGNKDKFDKPLEEIGEVIEVNIEEIKKKDLAEKEEKTQAEKKPKKLQ
jgi:predicted Zn-dependent peptidase